MSEPWNFTEAQRRQFRDAHAEVTERRMAGRTVAMCEDDHDWQPDPRCCGEGLRCTRCLVTEAELAGEDT